MIVIVTQDQVQRILEVTDGFSLDRDSVVIPLKTLQSHGTVMVLPDGKVLIHPPPTSDFEGWIATLPETLAGLDLRKTRRAS